VRKAVYILRYLLLAVRVFLRLEVYRLRRVSWYEAKAFVVREAVRRYLAHSLHTLEPTAKVLS